MVCGAVFPWAVLAILGTVVGIAVRRERSADAVTWGIAVGVALLGLALNVALFRNAACGFHAMNRFVPAEGTAGLPICGPDNR